MSSDDGSEYTSLFRKFMYNSASFDEAYFSGRYAWIDTIDNQELVRRLRLLTDDDLELLTLSVIEECSQSIITRKLGCNQWDTSADERPRKGCQSDTGGCARTTCRNDRLQ